MTRPRRLAPIAPILPNAPPEYDVQYMQRLIVALQNALLNIENPATLRGGWLNISEPRTPASATADGSTGDISWDSNYIYVCVSTNSWKRAALSTW